MDDEIASREELLVLLSEAARGGHVGSMRLLLSELARDAQPEPEPDPDPQPLKLAPPSTVVDELVEKRRT